jgi:hypothetical protein
VHSLLHADIPLQALMYVVVSEPLGLMMAGIFRQRLVWRASCQQMDSDGCMLSSDTLHRAQIGTRLSNSARFLALLLNFSSIACK